MSMWDDEAGYDRNDPKHPDWHSVRADIWDNRDKTAGEKAAPCPDCGKAGCAGCEVA